WRRCPKRSQGPISFSAGSVLPRSRRCKWTRLNVCWNAAFMSSTIPISIGRSKGWSSSREKAMRAMASSAASETERPQGMIARISTLRGRFGRGFWQFFAAAFLYDFGFGLFFFLFNLYLTDLHFNEKILGILTGTLTLGNVVGTIPVTMLVR